MVKVDGKTKYVRLTSDLEEFVEDYRRGKRPIPTFSQAIRELLYIAKEKSAGPAKAHKKTAT